MGFRLVPKSVTLNGVISRNSVAFGADYVKVGMKLNSFPGVGHSY